MGAAGRPVTVLTQIAPEFELTEKERLFATFLAEGKTPELALQLCGYKRASYAWEMAKKPDVIAYAQKIRAKNEKMMAMSRKRVMNGFMEAIEQAKLMSEPMTQIAGWREIAKMCGYYAPEIKRIDINVTSQRVMSQLETLSDTDLLELIEKDAELIEGEAREILGPTEATGGARDILDHSPADSGEAGGAGGDRTGDRATATLRSGEESSFIGPDGRSPEEGTGVESLGPEEPDPVREAAVSEVQSRVGA